MITHLKRSLIGVGVGGLAVVTAIYYWQDIIGERDAYRAAAEQQRSRAEILLDHQQFQRQQIKTLNSAMAKRDETLRVLADDFTASMVALERLGERDEQAREWLDSDLPIGIADWVRELQRTGGLDAMRPPSNPSTSDQ